MYVIGYHASKGYNKFRKSNLKEFNEISNQVKFITFYRQFLELFEIVKANLIEISVYIFEITEHRRINAFVEYDEFIDPALISNQKIANLLTSFRTFDDHICHKISNIYGVQSNEYKAFKNASKQIYDNYFAYRFLYKLRNYVQHVGLPVTKIIFNTKLEENKNKKKLIKHSVQLFLDKKQLLKYKGWGTVKNDLGLIIKDDILLNNLIDEFYYSFLKLYKEIQEIVSLNYIEARESLMKLYYECFEHSTEPQEAHNRFALPVFITNESKHEEVQLPINNIRRIDKLVQKNKINEDNFLISYSCIKIH